MAGLSAEKAKLKDVRGNQRKYGGWAKKHMGALLNIVAQSSHIILH